QDDFFLDPRCPSFALLSHRVPPVCLTLLSVRRFLEGIPGALPDEAKKALESNTAQAMNAATNVIGTPTKEGLVDKYSKDAASAVSAREVSEVLVQITGEAMKQDATMSVALLNQLSELAQQQVMTNTQLMLERQSKEQEIARNEEEFKAEVEQMVAENNAQAAEFQRDIKSAYSNMSSILKADIKLEPVGE
ncbi:hypothetical protein, partial [Deinococcus fonticola]|uniref:hypothetical protein n=1 Tax=Deinococcus fonticola TaxID=2528713 RepID=UPI00197ACD63